MDLSAIVDKIIGVAVAIGFFSILLAALVAVGMHFFNATIVLLKKTS